MESAGFKFNAIYEIPVKEDRKLFEKLLSKCSEADFYTNKLMLISALQRAANMEEVRRELAISLMQISEMMGIDDTGQINIE